MNKGGNVIKCSKSSGRDDDDHLTRNKGGNVRALEITHTAPHERVTRQVQILDQNSSRPFRSPELNLANLDFHICLFWWSLYVPFEYNLLVVHFLHSKLTMTQYLLTHPRPRWWKSNMELMEKLGFALCSVCCSRHCWKSFKFNLNKWQLVSYSLTHTQVEHY